MRRFIIIAHDAPTHADFSLSDLAGGAGRLDVLCRCVSASLLHSHGIRSNTEVITIHQDSVAVRIDGSTVRHLNPDERSIAGHIKAALGAAEDAVGAMEVEASTGVTVSRRGLADILQELTGPIVQLDPAGDPVTDHPTDEPCTYVLSDHHPFEPADREILEEAVDRQVSLGPVALHADQAITVVHNALDTDGYRRYGTPGSEPI